MVKGEVRTRGAEIVCMAVFAAGTLISAFPVLTLNVIEFVVAGMETIT
jgi:hypothetical protein